MLRRRVRKAVLTLGVLLVILLMPVILPVLWLDQMRQEWKLAQTRCVRCGRRVGGGEVRRAKRAARDADWQDRQATGRVVRRKVLTWHLACPGCGLSYTYHAGGRRGLIPAAPV